MKSKFIAAPLVEFKLTPLNRGTDDWYTFDPSCGIAVNEYLWLNDLHPTFPINNATAREIVALLDESS